jgi:hypothetical protein
LDVLGLGLAGLVNFTGSGGLGVTDLGDSDAGGVQRLEQAVDGIDFIVSGRDRRIRRGLRRKPGGFDVLVAGVIASSVTPAVVWARSVMSAPNSNPNITGGM